MVDPGSIKTAISGIFTGGMMGQMMYYLGYFLLLALILGAFVLIYFYMQYTIKATTFKMYGSGKDGVFSFAKPKKNRIRWIRKKTAWKPLYPLMNKKEIEPFDSEYIYPGNNVFAFELNDVWIPGRVNITTSDETKEGKPISAEYKAKLELKIRKYLKKKCKMNIIPATININKTEAQLRLEINPAPYYVRNWQSLEHKKNAIEFAKTDWWSQNKTLFIALAVGIACLVAVCVTIYFTYQFAGGHIGAMKDLTGAIRTANIIPGIAPG